MAKPKPGGRRPRKRDRKNISTGVVHIKSSFNNTIVTITDTSGQRHLVGVVGRGRLQGQPQEHALRRPAGRRAGRQRRHRARPAPCRGPREGPGLRPRHRRALDPEHRHRGHLDQGRHAGSAQRLHRPEASEGLSHGSLHRTEGARLAPPVDQHLREREGPQGARPAPLPARRPRPHPPPQRRQRVPGPAPGEAEGEGDLRRARAPVPQDLRRGVAPPGQHRSQPADHARDPARQHRATAPAGRRPARRPASS